MTLNNYTEREYKRVLELVAKYVILGREIGAEGTPHLQGYIQFRDPGKSQRACRLLCPRAHWEATKGSIEENIAYCSKGGSFEERGVRPCAPRGKGALEQKRWGTILGLSRAGEWRVLRENFPREYTLYDKALRRAHQRALEEPQARGALENEWYVGPSGSGKSLQARSENPGAYIKNAFNAWWDGYTGQRVVIIEDVDPNVSFAIGAYLKIWADYYAFQAESKGSQSLIRPQVIIVTSQYTIEEMFLDSQTRAALLRRFRVRKFPSAKRGKLVPKPPREVAEDWRAPIVLE